MGTLPALNTCQGSTNLATRIRRVDQILTANEIRPIEAQSFGVYLNFD